MLIANANANVIASALCVFLFLLSHSAAEADAFILWFPLSCNKSEEEKRTGLLISPVVEEAFAPLGEREEIKP